MGLGKVSSKVGHGIRKGGGDLMRWHCIARGRPCRRERTLSINTNLLPTNKAMTYDSLKYAVCDVWDESLQRWISVSKVEGAVDGWREGWVFKRL